MDLQRSLAHAALESHPHEAARVLEGLPRDEVTALLERTAPPLAAGVLRAGAPHFAAGILEQLPRASSARILEHLPVETAAGILRRLPETDRADVLGALPGGHRRGVESVLAYPPGTAASLADARALAFPEDVPVEEARKRLRSDARHAVPYVYVLDREDVLLGVLSLPEILTARSGNILGAIMRTPVESLPARASRRAVLDHPAWQTLSSLPVTDVRGVFLGAVRLETVRALEREARLADADPRSPTAQAIGDLLSTAIGGVIEAMASGLAPSPRPDRPEGRS